MSDFEKELKETGIKPGSGKGAEGAARELRRAAGSYLASVSTATFDGGYDGREIKRQPLIDPEKILPADILKLVSEEPESYGAHPIEYLAATWLVAKLLEPELGTDPLVPYQRWTKFDPNHPERRFGTPSANIANAIQQDILEKIDSATARTGGSRDEFIEDHQGIFATLFMANPGILVGPIYEEKDRLNLAHILMGGDSLKNHILNLIKPTNSTKIDSFNQQMVWLGFRLNPSLAHDFPVLATASLFEEQSIKSIQSALDRIAQNSYGGRSQIEGIILKTIINRALDPENENLRQIETRAIWSGKSPSELLELLKAHPDRRYAQLPPDRLMKYLTGELPEESIGYPIEEAQSYFNTTTNQTRFDRNYPLVQATRLIVGDLLPLITEDIRQHRGKVYELLSAISTRVIQGSLPHEPGTSAELKIGRHYSTLKLTEPDLTIRASNFTGVSELSEATGIDTYQQAMQAVEETPTIHLGNVQIDPDVSNALEQKAIASEIELVRETLGEQFGESLGTDFGDYRLSVAGKFSPLSGVSEVLSLLLNDSHHRNPFVPLVIRIASRLKDTGRIVPIEDSQLVVQAPIVGHLELPIPPNHPYRYIKALASLTPEQLLEAIKQPGIDITIPEVTLRKKDGGEIMSQEGSYQALEAIRQLGFDAILGESMADEFTFQAARVYVEGVLPIIGYSGGKLGQWQKRLVDLAEQAGYQGNGRRFIEQGLPMTYAKERELISYITRHDESVQMDNWTLEEYMKARSAIEDVMDFAVSNGLQQYTRYSKIPHYNGYLSDMRGGQHVISQEAQRHFVDKAIDWREFLGHMPEDLNVPGVDPEEYVEAIKLGKKIFNELSLMGHGNVIPRALQILKGEVAAVGNDITRPRVVQSWSGFFVALEEILSTPRLTLMISGDSGRLGFTINPRRDESTQ